MSAELDALIRKAHNLEAQRDQLATELTRLRAAIAVQMGAEREYYGKGVVAKKHARVRWEINKELLLDELSPDALAYLKEVVFTKEKLDQAIRAASPPPRLNARAGPKEDEGGTVTLNFLTSPSQRPVWNLKEPCREY